MDDIPNGDEETKFYKDIIQMARERKYFYPQVVLTCKDKLLQQLLDDNDEDADESDYRISSLNNSQKEETKEKNDILVTDQSYNVGEEKPNKMLTESIKQRFTEFELEQKLREIIDMKIEKVVLALGISRSSVHFIENYKTDDELQNINIDFKALRLLHECLQQCEQYVNSNLKEKKKSMCSIF